MQSWILKGETPQIVSKRKIYTIFIKQQFLCT